MTNQPFHIEYLADHLDFVETLARWHWDEWDHADPNKSLASTIDWMRESANRDTIPLTLVAFANGEPLGSTSLLFHDLETRPELSPWVVGVYTRSDMRGQGIGSALVQHAVDTATRLGITRLYLYTDAHGAARRIYERLGWQPIVEEVYKGDPIVIMAIETGVTERQAAS
jgi:GNAT superfamily N-acetyltransferase